MKGSKLFEKKSISNSKIKSVQKMTFTFKLTCPIDLNLFQYLEDDGKENRIKVVQLMFNRSELQTQITKQLTNMINSKLESKFGEFKPIYRDRFLNFAFTQHFSNE